MIKTTLDTPSPLLPASAGRPARRTRSGRIARAAGMLALAAVSISGLAAAGCRTDVVAIDVGLDNGEGCNAIGLRAINSLSIQVWSDVDDASCVFESQCINVDRSGDDDNPIDTLAELEAQFGDGALPLLDVPLESAQHVVVLGFVRADCVVMDENPFLCGDAEPDDADSSGRLALETDCPGLGAPRCEGTLIDSCL